MRLSSWTRPRRDRREQGRIVRNVEWKKHQMEKCQMAQNVEWKKHWMG
jgi:hypothetical protein